MAAAIGNRYAAKDRRWTAAINKAFERRSRVDQLAALDQLADKLIDMAMEGDLPAIKELGDRLEGKPGQQVILSGDAENPIQSSLTVEFKRPTAGET